MNATLVTSTIVLSLIIIGSINFLAQIITMFFLITYGTLCLVSFLEHFAGNPSYRPTFRSKWYLSLLGAVMSFFIMFQIQPLYALLAIIVMVGLYLGLSSRTKQDLGFSNMVKGVLFQLTRELQVLIQQKKAAVSLDNWRPSVIAISSDPNSTIAGRTSPHSGFISALHSRTSAVSAGRRSSPVRRFCLPPKKPCQKGSAADR